MIDFREPLILFSFPIFSFTVCSWILSFAFVQVVLLFLSGLTLSLTAQCTYGDKRYGGGRRGMEGKNVGMDTM